MLFLSHHSFSLLKKDKKINKNSNNNFTDVIHNALNSRKQHLRSQQPVWKRNVFGFFYEKELWRVWWAQVNWQTVQHSRTVDRKRA